MKAPWQEYPTYAPGSSGFRMGAAEDYIQSWWDFWRGLGNKERENYLTENPIPDTTKDHFGYTYSPGDWKMYVPLED